MILTTFRRIVRTGFVNFWRTGFLSFAAIVVMTLSLSAFGALIFGSAFGRALIADVKEKVDINVYFVLNAPEADIITLQKDIQALPEVSSVEYVSRDRALSDFREKWKNNTLIIQGLEEVGGNPFPASFNIKAKEPGQYGAIADLLQNKNPTTDDGNPIIEKINYEQNKIIIDRLGRIIPLVEQTGLAVSVILIVVAVIVVFNTIRLIIYTEREEIAVMKLVGASNIYVRGPLAVSGIMYGIVSALLTLVLMAVFAYWSDSLILRFAGLETASDLTLAANIVSVYFVSHFGQIFAIIVGAGIIMGGISSYVAARKYVKV